eukprot:7134267-Pyramimonas_sp.AAC.1
MLKQDSPSQNCSKNISWKPQTENRQFETRAPVNRQSARSAKEWRQAGHDTWAQGGRPWDMRAEPRAA